MILRTKVILIGLLVVLLVGVPPGLGQQPPVDSQGNLYSIWLKLSLMGHNQSEIEAILNGVTPCLLYTSPSPRDKRQSRMPSSA